VKEAISKKFNTSTKTIARYSKIFPLQGKSMEQKYVLNNHDNKNVTKNRSETKIMYPAQKNIFA